MSQATSLRDAVSRFLENRQADSPFLLARYNTGLETQIMTSRDGETTDNPGEFTADGETWKDKRWPYQAGSNPTYNDPPITFSPSKRIDRIGTTWWDFENKKSIAVGIDIDYTDGHAASTTTNDDATLQEIVDKLSALEYVTIVRSTGGKGLHVYVFFDNPPDSANHHEHTIVARKTLELIGQDIGYDLKRHVDCVGSVFWIWSKSSPADHPGFSLVKEGTTLDAGRLASIVLPTVVYRDSDSPDFEVVELEDEHRRALEAIAAQGTYFSIRQDMNLIHTHTIAIKRAVDAGLVHGDFETESDGSDLGTANCFLAPQPGGSFRVVRFGQSQHEPTWHFKNERNFCFINELESTPELVSRLSHDRVKDKYHFKRADIMELADSLGESLGTAPDDCWAVLQECGDIKIYTKEATDGWAAEGKLHTKTIKVKNKGGDFDTRMLKRADDQIRFVIQDGVKRGWFHRTASGEWLEHKSYKDLSVLVDGMFGEFATKAHRLMMENPWVMVKIPFRSEYPGKRQWNYNAPQLKVEPAKSGGDHKHFDMILEHVGGELDEAVAKSNWCRKANIQTGADYLRAWLACLIHHPDQPLPYLFLSGPQNSGKSVFHECCRFLFTHGISSAACALTSQFNGELEGCFLVYVEERDLGDKRFGAYSKIKEWVTGRDLNVRRMYQQPFSAPNYLHFVQMANSTSHLPLEDGDTRIVALDVPALKKPVPKAILEGHLKKEAPRFLRTLLNTDVPPPIDRLRIPALRTETKTRMELKAMTPLMQFCRRSLIPCDGEKIQFEEFYARYKSSVEASGESPDPDFMVRDELNNRSDRFELGIRNKTQYLLNVTLDEKARPKKRLETNESGRF